MLTLLPIIQDHKLPGLLIVSDLWRAYSTLGNLGDTHQTVNHLTLLTLSHLPTNTVEHFWMHGKLHTKKERGTSSTLLVSHVQEFVESNIRDDPFQNIVAAKGGLPTVSYDTKVTNVLRKRLFL